MKAIVKTLIFAAVVAVFSGCQSGSLDDIKMVKDNVSEDSAITMSRSMKGYELYSWKVGNDWKFVMVDGTNSLKSYDDIVAQPFVVTGVDGLLGQLKALAQGEQIFWNLKQIKGFAMPSDADVAKVTQYCKKRGIALEVISW
jgi:hypothetical protein